MSLGTFQGKPCKYGHNGLRYTVNRCCVECDRARQAAQREYFRAYQKVRRLRIKDTEEYKRKNRERMCRYRLTHAERERANRLNRAAVRDATIAILWSPT